MSATEIQQQEEPFEDHGAVPAATGEFVSDEQKQAYIAGLLAEKAGYEARVKAVGSGKPDRYTEEQLKGRVAEVDAELARVGHGGKTARKRGEAR